LIDSVFEPLRSRCT